MTPRHAGSAIRNLFTDEVFPFSRFGPCLQRLLRARDIGLEVVQSSAREDWIQALVRSKFRNWDGGIYSNTPIEAVLDDKPRPAVAARFRAGYGRGRARAEALTYCAHDDASLNSHRPSRQPADVRLRHRASDSRGLQPRLSARYASPGAEGGPGRRVRHLQRQQLLRVACSLRRGGGQRGRIGLDRHSRERGLLGRGASQLRSFRQSFPAR